MNTVWMCAQINKQYTPAQFSLFLKQWNLVKAAVLTLTGQKSLAAVAYTNPGIPPANVTALLQQASCSLCMRLLAWVTAHHFQSWAQNLNEICGAQLMTCDHRNGAVCRMPVQ